MKYTYETLDGSIAIEVDEKWHAWLTEADKLERNQERRHHRADHKYAQGAPLSLDAEDWLVLHTTTSYAVVELKIDLEIALETLTELQRRYFILSRMHGYSSHEIAKFEGKSQKTIHESICQAERKIRLFLNAPPQTPSATAR